METLKPIFFEDSGKFRTWFEKKSGDAKELLVGYWKKGTGNSGVSWAESVDVALCFGWIDGIRRSIDAQSYSIRFTPRRTGSNLSAVNISKFELLLAEGKVTQAGLDAFKLRKESKSKVYSYEQAAPAQLSQSETAEFKQQPTAWEYFESCPPGYRKKMLHWVTSAKKTETRSRRFKKLLSACNNQERLG